MSDSRLTRRSLVRGTAAGVAGLAAVAGTQGAFAAGSATVRQFTPGLRQALSGEITVSYPDEAGKKPKYVEQAADMSPKRIPTPRSRSISRRSGDETYMT